ncbi:MAG: N-glycosylase/DNA lyase [Minisyncoccia bacterium]|jgi:N-glycosylase/DNA lyase
MNIDKKLLKKIRNRLKEFKKIEDENLLFKELCFCILVANTSLEKTLEIWKKIDNGFLKYNKKQLSLKLKSLGYRFYNKRVDYILYNRKLKKIIKEKIKELSAFYLREWLVKNLKGIGFKEASHFLRNIGFKDFAILDRHILRFLFKNKIIREIPSNLSKRKYLEIENKLKNLADKLNITLSELDFLIFYLETGTLPKK